MNFCVCVCMCARLLIFFLLSALQDHLCVLSECWHTILHVAAYSLLPLAELDEHQVRGRNQRHGHWRSSEHICPPAVHMFTPDPSRVTVWVAPSLFPLRCPPQKKRLSFLLSRKFFSPGSNEPLRAAVFRVSSQSCTCNQVGPDQATAKL